MFISYTSTTVTSQLEFSTTASCLVNLCWSYNIHVASSPLTSVSVHANTAAFQDHPSFPFHAVPRNNQWPPRTSWASAELSVTQPVSLSASAAAWANSSVESVASTDFPYCIYHLHTCPHTKKKRSNLKWLLVPALVSCLFSLSLTYHPKISPLSLQLQG